MFFELQWIPFQNSLSVLVHNVKFCYSAHLGVSDSSLRHHRQHKMMINTPMSRTSAMITAIHHGSIGSLCSNDELGGVSVGRGLFTPPSGAVGYKVYGNGINTGLNVIQV